MKYQVRSHNRLISDGGGVQPPYGRAVRLFNDEVENNPGNKVELVTVETVPRVMRKHTPRESTMDDILDAHAEWDRGGGF